MPLLFQFGVDMANQAECLRQFYDSVMCCKSGWDGELFSSFSEVPKYCTRKQWIISQGIWNIHEHNVNPKKLNLVNTIISISCINRITRRWQHQDNACNITVTLRQWEVILSTAVYGNNRLYLACVYIYIYFNLLYRIHIPNVCVLNIMGVIDDSWAVHR